MRRWVIVIILTVLANANGLYNLQYNGVDAVHFDGKQYHIERVVPSECLDVPILSSVIWEGDFATDEAPAECKASFVTTVGVISPMKIADGVETYGELEVMRFIRQMQHQNNGFLLIDSRGSEWYEYETIPGAVNLWYAILKKPKLFPEEYEIMLQRMGVKRSDKDELDFSKAATLLLFCNGPWCGQSPMAIRGLLKLGYPAEKIKWYRGGMHDWKSLSMTTTLSK